MNIAIIFAFALVALAMYKVGGVHLTMAAASGEGAGSASPSPVTRVADSEYSSSFTIPADSVTGSPITHDPSTWPQGDTIWDVCRAIAQEEGASLQGSNPDRLNNPGDLSDYPGFGQEYHSGSNITHFPNKDTGWYYLYDKVSNIANGLSHTFAQDDTFYDIAKSWAPPNWEAWGNNVAAAVGVDPSSKLRDYIGV